MYIINIIKYNDRPVMTGIVILDPMAGSPLLLSIESHFTFTCKDKHINTQSVGLYSNGAMINDVMS